MILISVLGKSYKSIVNNTTIQKCKETSSAKWKIISVHFLRIHTYILPVHVIRINKQIKKKSGGKYTTCIISLSLSLSGDVTHPHFLLAPQVNNPAENFLVNVLMGKVFKVLVCYTKSAQPSITTFSPHLPTYLPLSLHLPFPPQESFPPHLPSYLLLLSTPVFISTTVFHNSFSSTPAFGSRHMCHIL